MDTDEGEWTGWNWRTDGDIMVNGAFFVPSGAGASIQYARASSVNPFSAGLINQLTMNAGVFGGPRYTLRLPHHHHHQQPATSLFLLLSFFTTIFPKTESTAVPVKSKGPFSKVETTVYGFLSAENCGLKKEKKSLIGVVNKSWLMFQKLNTKSTAT